MNSKCDYCGHDNADAAVCAACGCELSAPADGRSLVDLETSAWILKCFRWALEEFGTDIFYDSTILVTPSKEHFPEQSNDPAEMAALLFQRVQEYAGLQQWPCKLVPQEPDINPVLHPLIVVQNAPASPAGTFGVGEDGQVEITYNPAQVRRPVSLVATFAHEFAHYLGFTATCPPPGGEKNWEYATDVLAVHMGFGLFLANSAIEFAQFSDVTSQGWSAGQLGYLSEFELVYCLAVFCALKEIEREQLVPHLKPSLLPVYDDAVEDIRRKAKIVAELKRIRTSGNTNQKSA